MIKIFKSKNNENIKRVYDLLDDNKRRFVGVYGLVSELLKEEILLPSDGMDAEKVLFIHIPSSEYIEFSSLDMAKDYAYSLTLIK